MLGLLGGAVVAATGAGCAPRMALVRPNARVPAAAAGAALQPIYLIAADRAIPGLARSDGRGVGAAVIDVSIPPIHRPGRIEFRRDGDPARSFAVAGGHALGGVDTLVDAVLAASGPGEGIHVFVHGYNNTVAEAAFRHAQIAHDYVNAGASGGAQITFHWPSVAHPLGYAADRDAALGARSELAALLGPLLARAPGRVTLLGHSMGAFLVMETLALMAARRPGVACRLGALVLVSPDIAFGVFRDQLDGVGPLPDRAAVLMSPRDRALGLSARLTGQRARLGSIADAPGLRARGIAVIDLSRLAGAGGGGPGGGHSAFADSPAAIRLIAGLSESDALGRGR